MDLVTIAQLSNELCSGDLCPLLSLLRRLSQWADVCRGGHGNFGKTHNTIKRPVSWHLIWSEQGSWPLWGWEGEGEGTGEWEGEEEEEEGASSRYSYRLCSLSITSLPAEMNKALCNLRWEGCQGNLTTPFIHAPLNTKQTDMFELRCTADTLLGGTQIIDNAPMHTDAHRCTCMPYCARVCFCICALGCVKAGWMCPPDRAVHLQMLTGNWSLDEDCFLLQRVQVVCSDLFPGPTLSSICSLYPPEVPNLFLGA